MDEKKVRVGVVGVGSLGEVHARVYSELPNVDFVGVYDIDQDRSRRVAEKYATSSFTTLEELMAHSDAASLVVPTTSHRTIGGILIKHLKHVLIEKPIATTTQEAQALVELADKHNVVLQVGHIERFNPALHVLERIASNPRFIEAHRLAPYPPPRNGQTPRGTEVSVVLDLMIHDLEVILHLVRSPVSELRAVGVPILSKSDDIANVRISFENGCIANITASRVSPERMRKIRVFQEDTYISLDYQKQAGEIYRKTESGIDLEPIPMMEGEPLANELQSFASCIARKSQPLVGGQEATQALHLASQVVERIQENPA